MDRKSFIVLAICGTLFLLWIYLTPRLCPPTARPAPGTNFAAVRTNEVIHPPVTSGTNATTADNPPKGFTQPAMDSPEETIVLSNALARMTFTSRGGGIKLVELLKHRESFTCRSKKQVLIRPVSLNGPAPLPVLALTDDASLVGDGVYKLSLFPLPAPGTVAATNKP